MEHATTQLIDYDIACNDKPVEINHLLLQAAALWGFVRRVIRLPLWVLILDIWGLFY